MPMHKTVLAIVALASFATACLPGVARAGPAGDPPPPSFGKAASVERLQDMTGGTDTHVNNLTTQETNGTVSYNSAKNTISGSNMVGGNAFSNSAGLSTTIQNSGNNVLIQNSTIVNVRMNP